MAVHSLEEPGKLPISSELAAEQDAASPLWAFLALRPTNVHFDAIPILAVGCFSRLRVLNDSRRDDRR
jgi:hypothetical protein